MMHRDNCVVTVRKDGKPLREFDHSKDTNSSVVLIPFGSEYQLGIKVLDGVRRRIEITIDGTEVVSSLVLRPGENVIDRFQDVAKKFKFVRQNSPEVQDPSNPSNGAIVVKVWRENGVTFVPAVYHRQDPWYDGAQTYGGGATTYGPTFISGGSITCGAIRSSEIRCSSIDANAFSVSSLAMPTSALRAVKSNLGEAGATVEGDKSHQTFGNTYWLGDLGEPTVFTILLRGKDEVPTSTRETLCVQCSTPNPMTAKFCCECGLRIRL